MKINLLIVLFTIVLGFIIQFNWTNYHQLIVFYGLAHNQEININLEHAAKITAIHVTPGQHVKSGDILVEVERASLEQEQTEINHEISKLESQYQLWQRDLRNTLRNLRNQKSERKNELESSINKINSEININRQLIKDIESIEPIKDSKGMTPHQIELESLKNELLISMKNYDAEIRKIQRELENPNNLIKIQIDKMGSNLEYANKEEKKLNIVAPSTGIIGNILCKTGENIPAFTPYLNLYEQVPTHVKAYILENAISDIVIGDSIQVQSLSHSHLKINGKVTGLGSRIVEIPARLRKNPLFINYGREVEIEIPVNNPFLQNEKLILRKSTKTKIN